MTSRLLALALVLLTAGDAAADPFRTGEVRSLAVAGRFEEALAHWEAFHEPGREALLEQFCRRLRRTTLNHSSRSREVDEAGVELAAAYQPLFDLGLSLALAAQAQTAGRRDEIARQAAAWIVLGKGLQREVVSQSLTPELPQLEPSVDPLRRLGARLRDRVGARTGNTTAGTLVEVARFQRDWFDGRPLVDWYAAVVIQSDPSQPIKLIDLGAAQTDTGSGIDDLVAQFVVQSDAAVRNLGNPAFLGVNNRSVGQSLPYRQALDRVVLRVLGPCGLAAGTLEKYLFLSPAAQLWLVPFAAASLPDAPQKHLIDEYHISYLVTSRSLLAPDSRDAPPRGAALVTAPDFSLPTAALAGRVGQALRPPATPRALGSRDAPRATAATFACSGGSFVHVEGMQNFQRQIERPLQAAQLTLQVRAGADATEQVLWELGSGKLDALPAERLVVICTHGCYVSSESRVKASPLRGSLLALTGANHAGDLTALPLEPRLDGVLTAQEVVEKVAFAPGSLVLLMACQSAMGQVSGDHVASMRHAMLFKGAKSVVATSWTVDAAAANAFSVSFLQAYLKEGRAEAALRDAQLVLKQRTGWEHPVYWAPYSITGEL